jgi:hypothetical protein
MYTIKPKTTSSFIITSDYTVPPDLYNIIISNAMAPITVTIPELDQFTNSFEILFVNNSASAGATMTLNLLNQNLATIEPSTSKKYIIFDQLLYSVSSAGSASSTPNEYFKINGTSTMAAPLNMGGNKIINVADPVAAQDVATKTYFDMGLISSVGLYLKLDGTRAMTAALNMGASNKIINVADPVAAQDVATKTYADSEISFISGALYLKLDGTNAMSAALNMGGASNIVNVANPTAAQDAATKAYVDANVGTGFLKLDGTNAMSAALNMGSNGIVGVADPTTAQDAATKAYVDTSIGSAAAIINDGSNVKLDGTVAMTGAFNAGSNKIINVANPTAAQDVATKGHIDSLATAATPGVMYVNMLKDIRWAYDGTPANAINMISHNGYNILVSPSLLTITSNIHYLFRDDVYEMSGIALPGGASVTIRITPPTPKIVKGFGFHFNGNKAPTGFIAVVGDNGNQTRLFESYDQYPTYTEFFVNNTVAYPTYIFDLRFSVGAMSSFGIKSLQLFC